MTPWDRKRGKMDDHMDASKNRGTPKWMVKIMENPIKMDDLGVPLFLETPIFFGQVKGCYFFPRYSMGRTVYSPTFIIHFKPYLEQQKGITAVKSLDQLYPCSSKPSFSHTFWGVRGPPLEAFWGGFRGSKHRSPRSVFGRLECIGLKWTSSFFLQNGVLVFVFWSEKFEYKSLIGILIEGGELCVAII